MSPAVKIILDTDPGIDDAMAMAMLAGLPEIELLAITTVFGNADIAMTTRNALFLRRHLGLKAPVHQGAAGPLARPRGPGALHIHGDNALGGIALPPDTGERPDGLDAPAHIASLLRRHPGEVTILAIGPLTNLALALRRDPAIAGLARQVVVMGGAFGTDGRWGNVTPTAEANIHNDPEAAGAVLAAGWPVTLVGLDVTARCVLTTGRAAALRNRGATAAMLWQVSRFYAAAYARYDGLDGCCLHDVAAVALLAAPELFTCQTGRAHVVLDGPETGRTLLDPAPDGRHSACIGVDAPRLVDLFMATVMGPAGT
ncbi:nucleoside hydrolase [Niveispirillum fermenti]|uniref:nucleoside hydrolase n=1 Tax=Niveispirillum fermenti TaxID=1233113 RepID=UPI003A8C79FD